MVLLHIEASLRFTSHSHESPDGGGYSPHMMKVALALSLIVATFIAAPAIAHPLVVANLSVDTLLPSPVRSDRALAHAYAAHRARFDDAARQLGFSSTERALVDETFASGRARFVTVPRHLDAMSEYRDGRVQVLRDVVIPANEHGYAVSLQEPHGVLTAYVPSTCGNLSYVRSPRRLVAAARVSAPAPHVAAAVAAQPPPAAPGPPSYAIPEGARPYAVPVPIVVGAPVPPPPVYVPSYAVRVYVGPRYVLAPGYIPPRRYVAVRGYVPEPRYVIRAPYESRYVVRDRVYGYGSRPVARSAWEPHRGR